MVTILLWMVASKTLKFDRYGYLAVVWAALLLWQGQLRAVVTATTGSVNELPTPPSSFVEGDFEANGVLTFFEESFIDLSANQFVVDGGTIPNLEGGVSVPMGATLLHSYIFSYDAPGNSSSSGGPWSFTFGPNQVVLGYYNSAAALDNTDPVWGTPGTAYAGTASARALEEIANTSGYGTRTLTLTGTGVGGGFFVDQMRIIVATVPEPNSSLMLLLGVVSCLWRRRRCLG